MCLIIVDSQLSILNYEIGFIIFAVNDVNANKSNCICIGKQE